METGNSRRHKYMILGYVHVHEVIYRVALVGVVLSSIFAILTQFHGIFFFTPSMIVLALAYLLLSVATRTGYKQCYWPYFGLQLGALIFGGYFTALYIFDNHNLAARYGLAYNGFYGRRLDFDEFAWLLIGHSVYGIFSMYCAVLDYIFVFIDKDDDNLLADFDELRRKFNDYPGLIYQEEKFHPVVLA